MKVIEDVFSCWDSLPAMAADVQVSAGRVKKWWQRKRIPNAHWPALIAALNRKGKKLSADDLLVMHASARHAT